MMRKLVVPLILLVVLSATSWAQRPLLTDWQADSLAGHVRSMVVESTSYKEQFGKYIESLRSPMDKKNYNSAGYLLEWVSNRCDWKINYQYDDNSKLLKEIFYDLAGNETMRYVFGEAANRNTIEKRVYNIAGFMYLKELCTYDEVGNKTEESLHMYAEENPDGALLHVTTYGYDEYGNVTEVTRFNNDGSVDHKEVQLHDSRGRLISQTSYKGDGEAKSKRVYSYDPGKGQHVEQLYIPADSLVSTIVVSLDKHGNKIGEQTSSHISDKSNEGRLVSRTEYDYEYDVQGNWISMTKKILVTKYGRTYYEPKEATYRMIGYWD
jgi:YD repeat-containing protein